MICPAIATASSTSARKIQSWNAIWCAAIDASPKRVATAPARTKESMSAVVRMKIHLPSDSTRRASASRTRASPGARRRSTTTTNAAPIPSWAIAVPHADPATPQSKP